MSLKSSPTAFAQFVPHSYIHSTAATALARDLPSSHLPRPLLGRQPFAQLRSNMSAQEFKAALEVPDDRTSRKQLQSLASGTPVFSTSLLETAVAYLQAFCSHTHSPTKRRWIGLCLRNMLMASPAIVKRLVQLDPGLAQIGDVVLSASESEDTKIVAGLIVRQGLAQNIALQNFWKHGALLSIVTAFPKSTTLSWMKEFKSFVQVLQQLLLEQETTGLHVHHPLSLTMSEKDDWPDETRPLVYIQAEFITIIRLGVDARHVEFIDVPLQHIASMSDPQSTQLEDRGSKKRLTNWNITLEFVPKNWTYQVNLTEHNETNLIIMFTEKADAQAFLDDLKEFTGLLVHGKTPPSRTALDDAFGFPEQSTRIIRPPNSKTKNTSKRTCQKDNDSTTRVGATASGSNTRLPSNVPLEKARSGEGHEGDIQSPCKTRGTPASAEGITLNIENQDSRPEERSGQNHAQSSTRINQNPPHARQAACSAVAQLENRSETYAAQQVGESELRLCSSRRPRGFLSKQEQSQRIKTARVGEASATPAADRSMAAFVSRHALLRSPDMRSETSILQKLNSETNNENGNITLQSPAPAHTAVLGKRPFITRAPSTPPSKRVRRDHGKDSEKTQQASVAVPLSTRRSRILEDPSSPCGQRRQPSSALIQGPTRDKQSPPHMKANTPLPQPNVSVGNYGLGPRQTPIRHTGRGHSGEFNIELLSSNSKPTPASPHAESTAISGHADPRRVDMEKEIGDNEIKRTDPFQETALRKIKATTFTRKLSKAMSSPKLSRGEKQKDRTKNDDTFLEGDTLMERDEDPLPTHKDPPAYLCSSPPPLYSDSPSTPSSSSLARGGGGGAEPKSSSTPASVSDAEATAEWEANLQPHQRTLHERLFRVSNRVMRYIVDNETVIEDIAETYHHDGESLLESLVERHAADIDALAAGLDEKTDQMKRSCEDLLEQLGQDRTAAGRVGVEK